MESVFRNIKSYCFNKIISFFLRALLHATGLSRVNFSPIMLQYIASLPAITSSRDGHENSAVVDDALVPLARSTRRIYESLAETNDSIFSKEHVKVRALIVGDY